MTSTKLKKLLIALLSLTFIVCAAFSLAMFCPVAASAEESTEGSTEGSTEEQTGPLKVTFGSDTTYYSNTSDAVKYINSCKTTEENRATLTLMEDLTVTEPLYFDLQTVYATFDLNGHILRAEGDDISAICVTCDLIIMDSQSADEEYRHDYYVDETGLWMIDDGSEEWKTNYNNAESKGTITGGVITGGNKTSYISGYGGGIYITIANDVAGRVTMNGGTVAGNYAYIGGGGVYVTNYSTSSFVMNDGMIAGNASTGESYGYGGGIFAYYYGSACTINGGVIKDNVANLGGGIVSLTDPTYGKSILTINGGEICNNYSATTGGGVYSEGPFYMTGGTISGNMAANCGGVYLYGDLTMTGGSITGNSATGTGGGVYVDGTMSVSGKPVITGNTAGEDNSVNNVYLPTGIPVAVTGELYTGANIWLTAEDESNFITGFDTYNPNTHPYDFFTMDDGNAVDFDENGNIVPVASSYTIIYVGLNGTMEKTYAPNTSIVLETITGGEGEMATYGWAMVQGGNVVYKSGQIVSGGLGTKHGQVFTLYAVRDLSADVGGLQDELDKAIEAVNSAIDAVQDDLDSSVASLRAAISANAGDIADLEGALADLDAAYKAADTLIRSEFAAADSALAEKIADLEAAYKAADSALQSAVDGVQANLDKAVADLNASIAAGSADVADKLAELKAAYEAADALMGSDIAALQSQSEELSASIDALDSAYRAADEAIWSAIERLESTVNGRLDELRSTDTAVIAAFACVAGVLAIACAVALVFSFKRRKM